MLTQYVRRLTVRNYGCLKDVTVNLTPLHAFIGPNDSGKSTLLDAARAAVNLASPEGLPPSGRPLPKNFPLLWNENNALVEILTTQKSAYGILRAEKGYQEVVTIDGQVKALGRKENEAPQVAVGSVEPANFFPDRWAPRGARLVRFDPDAMRLPSALIPDTKPLFFEDERGRGLAGVFDAIRNRSDDAFSTVSKEVRALFPAVKGLRMINTDNMQKVLAIELQDGTVVHAERMSEGLLYFLGFEALALLEPVSLLLVEEPENGLHPSRIAEVVRVLRKVSERTQVLIATHSPLVINELKPEEVTVVVRDKEKGTQVHPISETPNFEERSKVYALGELWLSYANGDDESPLLKEDKSE